ncbi:MAG: protein-L-isoaspartate O-methyltransferase [Proteobacteria bacterium]|nr:protein-L-isoaspartate O-methyltransferase [Pseudomonadota bacterium]
MTLVEERGPSEMAQARRAMIDSQLRVSGVNDPAILTAFDSVAREDFVPAGRRAVAYVDRAVPLGDGSVLAPALTHGQMLTAAEVVPTDSVLVIGKACAYLAALAGKLAASVATAAPDDDWAAKGTFSLILVDGALEVVPEALGAALAANGRVVTGLVERGVTRLALGRKVAGELVFTTLAEADFAAIPEYAAPAKWSF